MDQLKVYLKQAIKHRFWIAVGISLILPVVAYVLGSGPVKAKADAETKSIDGAYKEVQNYASSPINGDFKPVVQQKKEELAKDVRESWQKLYDSQAPLLTWPERVKDEFATWGRKWPENVDASTVQLAIIDYVNAYPKYVNQVYESFRPFDPATGKGIVRAPSSKALLRSAEFSEQSPPGLGKVWAAQERLWLQRTMLDVIAGLNENAESWESAIVKQINALEVGNMASQDQRSLAKGDALEEAPDITAPGAPPPPPAATSGTSSSSSDPRMAMGGMGGQPQDKGDTLSYVKTDSKQYKVLPVMMTVLVDQDHIPDLLCAIENSPMAIQVKDFEMAKPATRVTKPEKGESMSLPGQMGYAQMMSSMSGPRLRAFGGTPSMSMPTTSAPGRTGISKRDADRAAKLEEERTRASKAKARTIHDPFYNIVEVTVYGQVRLYQPPPPAPKTEPSQSQAAGTTEPAKGDAPTGDAPKSAAPATGPEGEKKADEPAKRADEPKKGDEPTKKSDEPTKKADEPTKKADEPTDKGEKADDGARGKDAKKADETTKGRDEEKGSSKSAGEGAKSGKTPAGKADDSGDATGKKAAEPAKAGAAAKTSS